MQRRTWGTDRVADIKYGFNRIKLRSWTMEYGTTYGSFQRPRSIVATLFSGFFIGLSPQLAPCEAWSIGAFPDF